MSEKKSKIKRQTMSLPVYSVEQQIKWLEDFCKPFNFEPNLLLSYLLADFIFTVENGIKNGSEVTDLFFSYLLGVQRTQKKFAKIRKDFDEVLHAKNK